MTTRTNPWNFPAKSTLLAGAVIAFGLTHAWAHAFIDRAEPAVGSTVAQAPAEVRLTFTKELQTDASSVKVYDSSGKEVDKMDVHADAKDARRLSVTLNAPLAAGTYKVVWHATSIDTHVTQGDFTFRVQP